MDDLTLVRTLREDHPLPTPTDLSPARTRLLTAIAAAPSAEVVGTSRQNAPQGTSRPTVVPTWDNGTGGAAQTGTGGAAQTAPRSPASPTKRRKRGYLLAGASTLTAAAAVAAVLTLAPVDVVTGTQPPAASAAEVLNHAAAKARTEPFVEPRPDQFVYHGSTTGDQNTGLWLSVDGTRDGAIASPDGLTPLPGCRDGVRAVAKGNEFLPGVTEPCEPDPAYKRDLPTTADEMLAYLDANATGGPGNINARGKDVMELAQSLLKPASKAALFEAAARVEGLTVVRDTQDTTGRPAVGIEWPAPVAPDAKPQKTTLYFDPTTYEFLGTSYGPADTLSIVDAVGQRP
ncbi:MULTISPECIES: CU044_5270 family protein [unclassified Saccharothrix]|uniref:CU044_5270 family protein n=1 Tax=unclassified Saccharothrix TaxID=2593673 RepID=UPI00307FA074